MGTVKEDTLHGAKWGMIERFSVQGIQFVLSLIMARLLSPSDYGTIGMLAIFYAISQTFIDSGFGNALIRKNNCIEEDFSTVFYVNVGIAITCYCILFALAPWVAEFFGVQILCPILRVQSINLVLNSLMGVQVAQLTRNIDFKALAKRAMLATLVSGVFGVLLAYLGCGVWALVYQSILSTVINFAFIWLYCRWYPQKRFSMKSFKELFGYGSKLLASGLLNTIYTNLTTLIVGKFYSSNDLGFYSRGTQLARFPCDNINGVLRKVTFPILAKIQNDDKHLINIYRKYICFSSLVIFFVCTLLAAIAEPLVRFLLTEKWEGAIIYLQIICFAIMFDHVCSINLSLLQVKGRSDLFLRLEIIKKTISISILFASIPFGVIGICISKIIYTQIAVFINTYYTGKLFNLDYITQMKDFLPFLAYSILSCLPAYYLTFLNLPHVISILAGCTSASFLYWLILRKNNYMVEILEIVKTNIFIRKNI